MNERDTSESKGLSSDLVRYSCAFTGWLLADSALEDSVWLSLRRQYLKPFGVTQREPSQMPPRFLLRLAGEA